MTRRNRDQACPGMLLLLLSLQAQLRNDFPTGEREREAFSSMREKREAPEARGKRSGGAGNGEGQARKPVSEKALATATPCPALTRSAQLTGSVIILLSN